MSMFQALYTSAEAIKINQSAIAVINNNISNMNTEGYSKQRVDLQQGTAMPGSLYEKINIPIGGVEIDTITRYADRFLEGYYRQENSTLGYYEQMSQSLEFIEEYFNELDNNGISGAMTDFYAAAQEMSMDPTNRITRANFVQSAEIVAREFNATYGQLTDYRESLVGVGTTASLEGSQVYSVLGEINNKLKEVADLNKQISTFSNQNGVQPNSLLDQRQKVLNDLSEYIPITVSYDGTDAEVLLGKVKLIERYNVMGEFQATPMAPVPPNDLSTQPVVVSFGDESFTYIEDYHVEFPQESGQLNALLNLGGDGRESIYQMVEDLNLLAKEFARSVNDIQTRGEVSVGNPPNLSKSAMCMNGSQLTQVTDYIFLDDPTSTLATLNPDDINAKNIQINDNIIDNPFLIATAYVDVDDTVAQPPIVALNPDAVGNNDNALFFAQSRETQVAALGNFNVEDKMASMISTVGNLTSIIDNSYETQKASVDHVNEKKQSISGVNLDEELMDLVKYQNSYNASARVFSVIDDMMQMMINLLQ